MAPVKSELFHQVNTWTHFIGGYYSSTDKFISEARKHGISRRAPAQSVRGMQFGDRLIFLRYFDAANVIAFAEGEITGITLDHEIAKELGEKLKAEGKAEFHEPEGGSGMIVQRECGSFMLLGSWTVSCSLVEVMDMAEEIAKAKDIQLSVMVNARLVNTYAKPVYLQPTPKFSRGFSRGDNSQFVTAEDYQPERTVFEISNYQKAPKAHTSRRGQPLLTQGAIS